MGQDPPGPLLGRGREADVYDLGDGRVLRRYRRGRDATLEAEAMRVVRSAGVSCPTVFDADGSDIVMERIGGVTLATDMARRPWTVAAAGRTLASLHTQLHRIPAPATITRRVGPGDALLHLDLHPENVIVSSTGPVLIDWANAAVGDPAFDVAYSWLVLGVSTPPGGWWRRMAGPLLLGRCHTAMLDAVLATDPSTTTVDESDPLGPLTRERVEQALVSIPDRGLFAHENFSDRERARLETMIARLTTPSR